MPRHSSQYHSSFDAASARASVSSTPTHAGWNQPSHASHWMYMASGSSGVWQTQKSGTAEGRGLAARADARSAR